MKLSRKTLYALILLTAIAKKGEGNVTLKKIAEKEDISLKYLEQIANSLCKAGLIKSWRGPNGGYRLAEAASNIKTGTVVRLIEGDPTEDADDVRLLSRFRMGLCDAVNEYLDGVSISDLMEEERIMNGIYDYCI